jgi:hypothetical protein
MGFDEVEANFGPSSRAKTTTNLATRPVPFPRETTEPAELQELSRADEGTRTLDLLHGKQML